jgi:hypothetical protein
MEIMMNEAWSRQGQRASKKIVQLSHARTATRWPSFPKETGGLNANGVAYRGNALAIELEVKFPMAAYSDIITSTVNLRQVGQFKGSKGSSEG